MEGMMEDSCLWTWLKRSPPSSLSACHSRTQTRQSSTFKLDNSLKDNSSPLSPLFSHSGLRLSMPFIAATSGFTSSAQAWAANTILIPAQEHSVVSFPHINLHLRIHFSQNPNQQKKIASGVRMGESLFQATKPRFLHHHNPSKHSQYTAETVQMLTRLPSADILRAKSPPEKFVRLRRLPTWSFLSDSREP